MNDWGKFIACSFTRHMGGRESARIILEDENGMRFVEIIEIGEKAYT